MSKPAPSNHGAEHAVVGGEHVDDAKNGLEEDDGRGEPVIELEVVRVSEVFEDDVDLFVDLKHNFMVNASPTPLERTAWELLAKAHELQAKIASALEAVVDALTADVEPGDRGRLGDLSRGVDRFHEGVHSAGISGMRVRALERAVARFAPYREVLERSAPPRPSPEERRDELLALLETACAPRRLRSAVRELACVQLQLSGIGAVRKYLREHSEFERTAQDALTAALKRGHTLESIAGSPDSPVRFARTRLLNALADAMPEVLDGLNLEHANAAIVALDMPPRPWAECELARDYVNATGQTTIEKWTFLQLWIDDVLDLTTAPDDVLREAQNLRKRRDRRHRKSG